MKNDIDHGSKFRLGAVQISIIAVPSIQAQGWHLRLDCVHYWFEGKAEEQPSKRIALVESEGAKDVGGAEFEH